MSRLIALTGLAVVLSLALMASSASATQPVVRFHLGPVTSDPFPETWCGVVDGTAVTTVVEEFRQDGSGSFIDNIRFTSVFTATATGKSIESSGGGLSKVSVMDNGDGTISFAGKDAGLALFFQDPRRPDPEGGRWRAASQRGRVQQHGNVRYRDRRVALVYVVIPRPALIRGRRGRLRTVHRLPTGSVEGLPRGPGVRRI